MAASNFLRSKREAQAIARKCYIRLPEHIDLEAIAALYDIYVLEDVLEGAEARLHTQGNRGIVTIRKNIPEVGRKRFALAHDIGHFILHRSRTRPRMCTESEFLNWYHTSVEEPEANVFAAELLMPEKLFKEACTGMTPGFRNVEKLSQVFTTSISSSAFRYVEIGNYPCALICCRAGKLAWFNLSTDYCHRVLPVGTGLHRNTAVWEFFNSGKRPPDEQELTLPEYWLEAGTFDSSTKLFVHCLAMPRYDTIMVLLWEP